MEKLFKNYKKMVQVLGSEKQSLATNYTKGNVASQTIVHGLISSHLGSSYKLKIHARMPVIYSSSYGI